MKRLACGFLVAGLVAAAPFQAADADGGADLRAGETRPLLAMFCDEADPAISLMAQLVEGDAPTEADLGARCGVLAEYAKVETVHSRQADPKGRVWTLASVQLPRGRSGYVLTTLGVSDGQKI